MREITLAQWQLDAIIAMDVRRRQLAAVELSEPSGGAVVISERPMTMELFDALF